MRRGGQGYEISQTDFINHYRPKLGVADAFLRYKRPY
jgi:hypothetical protein